MFVFQVALAVLADVAVARVAKLGRLHRELAHDSHQLANTHSFHQNVFTRKDVIVDIHEKDKDQYHEADCDNCEYN
jgi:hypothetical protein